MLLAAAAFRRLAMQFFEQRRGGMKQHAMTREHRTALKLRERREGCSRRNRSPIRCP